MWCDGRSGGCDQIHGSDVPCDVARVKREAGLGYTVGEQHGVWWVFRGEAPVTRGFLNREVAEDFAALLNHARTWR